MRKNKSANFLRCQYIYICAYVIPLNTTSIHVRKISPRRRENQSITLHVLCARIEFSPINAHQICITKLKNNTTYLCVHVNNMQLREKLQVMWLSTGIIQTLITLFAHRFPFFKTDPQGKQKILAGILIYFVSCCLCFRNYESELSLSWQNYKYVWIPLSVWYSLKQEKGGT